jgi:hypothetical protein
LCRLRALLCSLSPQFSSRALSASLRRFVFPSFSACVVYALLEMCVRRAVIEAS